MKKTTTFFTLLTAAFISNAQITMTSADFPVAGEYWVSVSDNSTSHTITAGNASAQAWDLSAGFVANDTGAFTFINPSTLPAPYNGQYATADLATYSALDSLAQYFEIANDGFYIDGIYTESNMLPFPVNKIDFISNSLVMPVPFTYGNSRNNTSKMQFIIPQGIITIKFVSTTNESLLCDAFGTIKLPNNATHTVIRIKRTEMSYDSTYVNYGLGYQLQDSGGDTTLNYQFWKNGSQCLVAELNSTYANPTHSDDFQYYDNTIPYSVNKNLKSVVNVVLYPNPSVNNQAVKINILNGQANAVKVYDINGKIVVDEALNNVNQLMISTQNMNSGLYMYQIINNGEVVNTGKFNVEK